MKKLTFVVCAAWLLLEVVVMSPVSGAPRGGRRRPPPSPPPAPAIVNVGPTSITISEQSGAKTYTITQFTEVNVNGQRATPADLKPGMTVSVTLSDPSRVSRINASDTVGKKK